VFSAVGVSIGALLADAAVWLEELRLTTEVLTPPREVEIEIFNGLVSCGELPVQPAGEATMWPPPAPTSSACNVQLPLVSVAVSTPTPVAVCPGVKFERDAPLVVSVIKPSAGEALTNNAINVTAGRTAEIQRFATRRPITTAECTWR
jgi:hypothetical protein